MTKMCGGAAAGDGSAVGLDSLVIGDGVGLCVAVTWAGCLGAQAARRQTEMTRATNRIRYEPTIQPP